MNQLKMLGITAILSVILGGCAPLASLSQSVADAGENVAKEHEGKPGIVHQGMNAGGTVVNAVSGFTAVLFGRKKQVPVAIEPAAPNQ